MSTLELFSTESESESDEEINLDKLPWIEKYRPKSLDELISHTDIMNSMKIFIKNKYMPHMLFYGPPGTGKTSTILAYARELYGINFNFMVLELNASDDRGIEVVRNKVKQFVSSTSTFCKFNTKQTYLFKLVILDETDSMTDDAQAILRQVVEKYTHNARFCLICNYIKKISSALQSRCISFRFAPLKKTQILNRLDYVIKCEDIDITKNGKDAIIKHSNGDMRRVLNMLQSSSMIYKTIDEDKINYCFGYPQKKDIKNIIKHLITKDIQTTFTLIKKIIRENGISLTDIITEIYNNIIDYIITEKYSSPSMKKLTNNKIILILDKLRLIEVNQTSNTNEDIQISGFISIFKLD
jgi:replication factor C subunit 3/5